ncbi:MAG: 4a-hydroxytetrahydrobiopterin dehydratase [Gammaproteobacteria bacterium]
MTDLTGKKCVPCEGGIAPLSPAEAQKLRQQLDAGWTLVDDFHALRREFKFKDFYRTMSFVNALAHIANLEDHHPDLEVGYGTCRVLFTTHAIKGLSENDFICAAKIDRIPLS